MATYLDFLMVLDDHVRSESAGGQISQGHQMTIIARDAGLLDRADQTAASWTGQLVRLGLVEYGPRALGAPKVPDGVTWTDRELQDHTGYVLTADGHAAASRERRARREISTDIALGMAVPTFARAAAAGLDPSGAARIVRSLQSALDDELPVTAVGAAKELVEAACRWVLGAPSNSQEGLSRRYKLALKAVGVAPESALGNRLSGLVHELNEMRNESGAGHGGHSEITLAEARLAAASAMAVTEYLLNTYAARPHA